MRTARTYAGLSRAELAHHLEISERTQINSELGNRHVPRPELLAIADATAVPLWFLERGWEGWRDAGDVDAEAREALRDLGRREEKRRSA